MIYRWILNLFLIACSLYGTLCAEPSSQLKQSFTSQFHYVDSLFLSLVAADEIRMKELDPADGLFKAFISKYPEFKTLVRTSSKGVVVNEVGDGMKSRDLSTSDLFVIPKTTGKPFFGKIEIEGDNSFIACSQPITVSLSNGEKRFGGVVICRLDYVAIIKRIVRLFKDESFEILANDKPVVRNKMEKVDLDTFSEQTVLYKARQLFVIRYVSTDGEPAIKPQKDTMVDLTAPAKQGAQISRSQDSLFSDVPATAKPNSVSKTSVSVTPTPPETPETMPQASSAREPFFVQSWFWMILFPLVCCILAVGLYFSVFRKRFVKKLHHDADETLIDFSEATFEMDSTVEEITMVASAPPSLNREELVAHLRKEIAQQISRSEIKKITSEVRQSIVDDVTQQIRNNELDTISVRLRTELTAKLRENLTSEIHQHIVETETQTLTNEIRALHRQSLETELIAAHGQDMELELYEQLRINIQARVKLESEQSLYDASKNQLSLEIRSALYEKEYQSIKDALLLEAHEAIRADIEKNESVKIQNEIRRELAELLTQLIRDQEEKIIYNEQREKVAADVRNGIVADEMESIIEEERSVLAQQIHKQILSSEKDALTEKERKNVRADIVAILQHTEYAALVAEERTQLRATITKKLEETDAERIAVSIRDEMQIKIRHMVRTREIGSITERMRSEIASTIHKELLETESEGLKDLQREKLSGEIRVKMEKEEKATIADKIRDAFISDEMARVNAEERPEIVAEERRRVLVEEGSGIRESVRKQIHEEELAALHERIKKDIYDDTVEILKLNLDEKYKAVLQEKLRDLKVKTRSTLSGELLSLAKADYSQLLEHLDHVQEHVAGTKILDSYRTTLHLLKEEKKKYKYFNLNSTQTESLLAYLDKQNGLFEEYFEELTEGLKKATFQMQSLLNTFENRLADESHHSETTDAHESA